ncbi:glycosyltransferase family 32 protein, partial [Canariomyces notabilis]
IPRQIWQIFFSPPHAEDLDKRALFASEWISMTPGYAYSLLNTLEADQFINTTFTSRPEIAQTYHALKNPGAKSDFLRYLLLLTHGGIYTDLDTQPLVGPEDWLPEHKRRDAAIIIGLESDSSRDHGPGFPDYPVQFCQWTIAAAPNHPILHRMVNRTIEALKHLAQEQRTTLDQVRLGDEDVLQLSGPRAWSEVVLAGIKELDATVTGLSDLQGMDEPRYYRDIAVMPVLSF